LGRSLSLNEEKNTIYVVCCCIYIYIYNVYLTQNEIHVHYEDNLLIIFIKIGSNLCKNPTNPTHTPCGTIADPSRSSRRPTDVHAAQRLFASTRLRVHISCDIKCLTDF